MKTCRILIGLVAVLVLGLSGARAWGQPLPKAVIIGTNPPGTLFYALASGLAKVIAEATPMQATIQPYTGTTTWLPLVNSGELDFGVINAVDLGMAYVGPERLKVGGRNPHPYSPRIRLVMRGAPLLAGLIVRKDSPIRSVHEIKGKRLTGEYPAQLAIWYNLFGMLASAGLGWNDVKIVPVTNVNDGIDALVQRRADVTTYALNAAKVREADVTVGVRYIQLDCSSEGDKRVRQAVPGYYLTVLKAGSGVGIVEDTCMLAYDLYFLTHKASPDRVVATVLRAIWDNIAKLPPLHPTFKDWTREQAVTLDMTIPYHPGAVQLYKEWGVWKAEVDQAQQRLLALNP